MVSNDLNLHEFDQVGDTYSTLIEKLNLNNDQFLELLKLIMSGNNHETFELGDGKSVITLKNAYLPNNNSVQVFINGSQTDKFTETDDRTITLLTPVSGITTVSVYYKSSQNFPADTSGILSKYSDMYKDLQSAKEVSEAIRDVLNKNGDEVTINAGTPTDYSQQISQLTTSLSELTKSLNVVDTATKGMYTKDEVDKLINIITQIRLTDSDYGKKNQPSYYFNKAGTLKSLVTFESQSYSVLDEDDQTTDGLLITTTFTNKATQIALVGTRLKMRTSANDSSWNSWSVIYDVNKPNGVDLNELNSIVNNKVASIDAVKYIITNNKLYKTSGGTLNLDSASGLPLAKSGKLTMATPLGMGVKASTSDMSLDTSQRVTTVSIKDADGNPITDARQISDRIDLEIGLYGIPAISVKGSEYHGLRSTFSGQYPKGVPASMLAILYRNTKTISIKPSDIEQGNSFDITTEGIDIYGNTKQVDQPLFNLDAITSCYVRGQRLITMRTSDIRYQIITDAKNPGTIKISDPNYYTLISLDGSVPSTSDIPTIDTYWLIPYISTITVY